MKDLRVQDILNIINDRSPFSAACDWDNVGLLVGNADWEVRRLYLALDATDEVIAHAAEKNADLLVTHHPMIFSPMKRIVADDFIGRRVISLIEHRIAYIAMHTNYDVFGMADLASEKIGLLDTEVLEPEETPDLPDGCEGQQGIGRIGRLEQATTLRDYASVVRDAFGLSHTRYFGADETSIERVAICPGSGKSVIGLAIEAKADVLVTGDIDHHSGIDAVAQGLCIIDAGHYGVEHIFIEDEKAYLTERLGSEVEIFAEPFAEPISLVVSAD